MKAVVLDQNRAHIVAVGGEIVSRPSRAMSRTISQVAAYVATTAGDRDCTLVYACPPRETDAATAIAAARSDGWTVTDADADAAGESGWFTLRRPDSTPVHVHVTAWRSADTDQLGALWAPDDDAGTITDRIGVWYRLTGGQTWHTHPSIVAAGWLRDTVTDAADRTGRRHGVIWRYRPPWLPPRAGGGEWRNRIDPPSWRYRAYDGNGEWLAAESVTSLPYGKLEQAHQPVPFDPSTAGWWLVDTRDRDGDPLSWWYWATSASTDTRPPLLRMAPNAEGRVWLSTPVMSYLAEDASGRWELDPVDVIWPAADDKGRRRCGRIMRPWAERCRDARRDAIDAADPVMVDAVKAVYSTMLTAALAGGRIDRQDWAALIGDTIVVARHRRYTAGLNAGYRLLATQADASWWAMNSDQDPAGLDRVMGLRDRRQLGGTKLHHKPLP